ncbi:hypothetical protein GF373_12960 [bacterium]|nr:hypothetical protein [bacterium]
MTSPFFLVFCFLIGWQGISFADETLEIKRNPFTPYSARVDRQVPVSTIESATSASSTAQKAVASPTREMNAPPDRFFPPAIALQGVILAHAGPKYALFGQELLTIGDRLENWEITDIQMEKVILVRESQTVERWVGQQIDRPEPTGIQQQAPMPSPFSLQSGDANISAGNTLRFLRMGQEIENKLRQGDIQGMTPYINPLLQMIFKGEKPNTP